MFTTPEYVWCVIIFEPPSEPSYLLFRLAVLGKLNNFVKEWIAEISELKVGSVTAGMCVFFSQR